MNNSNGETTINKPLQLHGTGSIIFLLISLEMVIYPLLTSTMILFQMYQLSEVTIGEEKTAISLIRQYIQGEKLDQN